MTPGQLRLMPWWLEGRDEKEKLVTGREAHKKEASELWKSRDLDAAGGSQGVDTGWAENRRLG